MEKAESPRVPPVHPTHLLCRGQDDLRGRLMEFT